MEVSFAYKRGTINLCRKCYENPPEDFPALGPVNFATYRGPCVVCKRTKNYINWLKDTRNEVVEECD